jgi:integrase
LQEITPVIAENYIGFIRTNGAYRKFRKSKKPAGLSNDTINEMHRTCQQVFELLKHESGMFENPFAAIPKLQPKHAEREAYTDAQLKEIFLKADNYLQPLFFIGLFTGLSEGDVCTLRKDEIHFDRHHIYRVRNKTRKSSGKVSAIPMLPVLEDFLKRLLENAEPDCEYILPEQAAEYLERPYELSRKIKYLLEVECGFDTTLKIEGRKRAQSVLDFHSLRHTFCSIAGVAGVPLTVVQSIVGHMTRRMTELYSRHVEEKERLHWIRIFGERINCLPGIMPDLPQIAMEPEREELLAEISKLDITAAREMLEMLKNQKK